MRFNSTNWIFQNQNLLGKGRHWQSIDGMCVQPKSIYEDHLMSRPVETTIYQPYDGPSSLVFSHFLESRCGASKSAIRDLFSQLKRADKLADSQNLPESVWRARLPECISTFTKYQKTLESIHVPNVDVGMKRIPVSFDGELPKTH